MGIMSSSNRGVTIIDFMGDDESPPFLPFNAGGTPASARLARRNLLEINEYQRQPGPGLNNHKNSFVHSLDDDLHCRMWMLIGNRPSL
jgi:hypothetical protein